MSVYNVCAQAHHKNRFLLVIRNRNNIDTTSEPQFPWWILHSAYIQTHRVPRIKRPRSLQPIQYVYLRWMRIVNKQHIECSGDEGEGANETISIDSLGFVCTQWSLSRWLPHECKTMPILLTNWIDVLISFVHHPFRIPLEMMPMKWLHPSTLASSKWARAKEMNTLAGNRSVDQ